MKNVKQWYKKIALAVLLTFSLFAQSNAVTVKELYEWAKDTEEKKTNLFILLGASLDSRLESSNDLVNLFIVRANNNNHDNSYSEDTDINGSFLRAAEYPGYENYETGEEDNEVEEKDLEKEFKDDNARFDDSEEVVIQEKKIKKVKKTVEEEKSEDEMEDEGEEKIKEKKSKGYFSGSYWPWNWYNKKKRKREEDPDNPNKRRKVEVEDNSVNVNGDDIEREEESDEDSEDLRYGGFNNDRFRRRDEQPQILEQYINANSIINFA